MNSVGVTVSSRGYILIPAKIRKELNIKGGSKILLTKETNKVILQPVPSFTAKLSGITGRSFGKTREEVDKYVDDERRDR